MAPRKRRQTTRHIEEIIRLVEVLEAFEAEEKG